MFRTLRRSIASATTGGNRRQTLTPLMCNSFQQGGVVGIGLVRVSMVLVLSSTAGRYAVPRGVRGRSRHHRGRRNRRPTNVLRLTSTVCDGPRFGWTSRRLLHFLELLDKLCRFKIKILRFFGETFCYFIFCGFYIFLANDYLHPSYKTENFRTWFNSASERNPSP